MIKAAVMIKVAVRGALFGYRRAPGLAGNMPHVRSTPHVGRQPETLHER
jgi:hypothetical protein